MAELTINDTRITYVPELSYQSIGVVGSTHGGDVYDVYPLTPNRFSPERINKRDALMLVIELEEELYLVSDFLVKGHYQGGNGPRTLNESERPQFERTIGLYNQVIAALRGK